MTAGVPGQDADGTLAFVYDTDCLQAGGASATSFSTPLREEQYSAQVARPFFSVLFPDEGARLRLAGALGLSSGNAFGLLEVIGGECAGALSLYRNGEATAATGDDGVEVLTSERVAELIGKLRGRPLLGGVEGVRLSLAGAQDKLAVVVQGDAIGLAKSGARRPTFSSR